MFFTSEDVVAAGLLANAVDADVIRVGTARRSVRHFVFEQVISARMLHSAVQPASVFYVDCTKETHTHTQINKGQNYQFMSIVTDMHQFNIN